MGHFFRGAADFKSSTQLQTGELGRTCGVVHVAFSEGGAKRGGWRRSGTLQCSAMRGYAAPCYAMFCYAVCDACFTPSAAVNHVPEELGRPESRIRDSGRDSGLMNYDESRCSRGRGKSPVAGKGVPATGVATGIVPVAGTKVDATVPSWPVLRPGSVLGGPGPQSQPPEDES